MNRFLQFVLILALAAGITIGIFASSRLQRVSSTYELALEELQEWNAKLTASQQLLATTLESIGDAVISLTKEGNVRFMNAVAQKLTGWPLSAATAIRWARCFAWFIRRRISRSGTFWTNWAARVPWVCGWRAR